MLLYFLGESFMQDQTEGTEGQAKILPNPISKLKQAPVGGANTGTMPLEGNAYVVDVMIVKTEVEQSGLH